MLMRIVCRQDGCMIRAVNCSQQTGARRDETLDAHVARSVAADKISRLRVVVVPARQTAIGDGRSAAVWRPAIARHRAGRLRPDENGGAAAIDRRAAASNLQQCHTAPRYGIYYSYSPQKYIPDDYTCILCVSMRRWLMLV